ncbi:hypothetical protein C8Z91_19995 [Paenibacillus elgii]|uniref:Uncharacterized protein n=1 Tax=Paenibacillus elgii TaxID=189691 RepID=A0A2T6G0E2_9BACL|nr:hypothetical protein C8Z91_19995 [Paenibacillus elgii]
MLQFEKTREIKKSSLILYFLLTIFARFHKLFTFYIQPLDNSENVIACFLKINEVLDENKPFHMVAGKLIYL